MIRFGPFQVDPRTWSLSRGGDAVDLSPRLVEILTAIIEKNGEIVTKDELLDRFWPGVNISENTLTRAIADIRKALGEQASEPQYIQTLARRGFRFVGAAETGGTTGASESTGEDPFQSWVQGKLALDSLNLEKLTGAIAAFERAVVELPSYAPAHAGLANAYLMQFEQTRSGSVPDRGLLTRAMTAAKQACAVDPSLGEGWAVLGYLLSAAGKTEEAQAAARRAAALEPDNWRHQYRLAYSAWGEERLRAAGRTLTLMPGSAPVRMLSAMVFIARGTLDRAEREATVGAETQRRQRGDRTPLPAIGFHWLRGLLLAARGDTSAALSSLDEESTTDASGHIYAREFVLNARVATGFMHLTMNDSSSAAATFNQALAEAPAHPRATLGLYAVATRGADARECKNARTAAEHAIADLMRGERHVEAALVSAGQRIVEGQTAAAMELLDRMLADAPAGPAGWIIPVDPMLEAVRVAPGYPELLAKLAARAS
ncbi:MAG: winged helix-turn-helix domain-containing protein [Acidobacteriota bacterium]|nr:winged helix-turn-helix domain-containing protein [Acidobacteriota bacterium]